MCDPCRVLCQVAQARLTPGTRVEAVVPAAQGRVEPTRCVVMVVTALSPRCQGSSLAVLGRGAGGSGMPTAYYSTMADRSSVT